VVQVNIVNGAQIKALNLLRGNLGCLSYAASRLYVADRQSNTVLVVNPTAAPLKNRSPNKASPSTASALTAPTCGP